jgi:hypothetical protein
MNQTFTPSVQFGIPFIVPEIARRYPIDGDPLYGFFRRIDVVVVVVVVVASSLGRDGSMVAVVLGSFVSVWSHWHSHKHDSYGMQEGRSEFVKVLYHSSRLLKIDWAMLRNPSSFSCHHHYIIVTAGTTTSTIARRCTWTIILLLWRISPPHDDDDNLDSNLDFVCKAAL